MCSREALAVPPTSVAREGHGASRTLLDGAGPADTRRSPAWRLAHRAGSRAGYEIVPGVRASPACAARACCARLLLPVTPAHRLLAVRPRDLPREAGRRARHGRLHLAFPGGMMAALLRPLVLHEQNSIAGLANRVLAKLADRRLQRLPRGTAKKAEWTGNPVRADIARARRAGRALRRPQRSAETAGRRRQSGRAGAQRSRACGAGD
jgi:hypothetical protein